MGTGNGAQQYQMKDAMEQLRIDACTIYSTLMTDSSKPCVMFNGELLPDDVSVENTHRMKCDMLTRFIRLERFKPFDVALAIATMKHLYAGCVELTHCGTYIKVELYSVNVLR